MDRLWMRSVVFAMAVLAFVGMRQRTDINDLRARVAAIEAKAAQ